MASEAGAGSLWNKNSWHWEEKDYTKWALEYLKEALVAVSVEKGATSVAVSKVKDIKGHAAVNIRKGKKVISTELSFKAEWSGTDGKNDVEGTVECNEIMTDDIADGDYDMTVKVKGSGGAKARNVMRKQGVAAIKQVFTTFVDKLKAKAGDEAALAADKARRAEEERVAAEAAVKAAAAYDAASKDVEAREAAQREIEARKAASQPQRVKASAAVEGQGSVWNKGSYHWEEAPHHEWARTRLKELFDTFHIDLPSVILACAPTTKVSGDATTSVRKGKKLVFFQLKVEAEWMAEAVDYDGNILARVEGELQLPDVDQENYNTDDLVMEVTTDDKDEDVQPLVTAMKQDGAKALKALLAQFVKELQAR